MIKKLDWSSENIVAYEASGIMSKEENIEVFNELEGLIGKYGKVRIFVYLPKMAWPEPAAFGVRLSFARKHFNDIERYAVVSDIKALGWLIDIMGFFIGLFTHTRYKYYAVSDELLAKTWINAKH